jgi:hypothetical protein
MGFRCYPYRKMQILPLIGNINTPPDKYFLDKFQFKKSSKQIKRNRQKIAISSAPKSLTHYLFFAR